jgi:predicted permease
VADLWLAIVVTSAIGGLVGYVFARKTGRDAAVWTAVGIVLNVIILAIIPMLRPRRS